MFYKLDPSMFREKKYYEYFRKIGSLFDEFIDSFSVLWTIGTKGYK